MQDEDGTGIEEYAELIENEDIIQLVKEKLGKWENYWYFLEKWEISIGVIFLCVWWLFSVSFWT